MARPFLSIIIPCYNEATRLPLTLIDVDRHLADQEFESEIVIVVSQGTDNTPEILKRFSAIIKNLRVINLSENLGRGYAVKTGMLAARGSWRLVMDADNSTTLTELAKMLPYVTTASNACDIAIGSRLVEGAHVDPPEPGQRRLSARIGRWLTRACLVKNILDTTCGFKLFSATSAEEIFKRCVTTGWATDTEALAIAQSRGYTIKELPVFWAYDPGTHRSSISGPSNFTEHLRIWWGVITRAYKK